MFGIMRGMDWGRYTGVACVLLLGAGCITVRTEHRVEPIHITVDVNVNVERELDNFFGDIDAASETRVFNDDEEGDLE